MSVMYNLSPQKRKILAIMAREDDEPIRVIEITRIARLKQQNRTSSVVHRLKNEGYLTRDGGKGYTITDPDLRNYIRMKSRMDEFSKASIEHMDRRNFLKDSGLPLLTNNTYRTT